MSTIVMCADHGTWNGIEVDGAEVIAIPDLCRRPGQLATAVPEDETLLLLGLHTSEAETGRVQAAVRRLGFDPLGVGVLDLERLDDDDSVTMSLAALMARFEAYPGSVPEQVKLVPRPVRSTRRSLLSLGVPTYTGAPKIDDSRCVAHDGCQACVDACPADALTRSDGVVRYDKTACVTCGFCITTCPTGAVVNPVATPEAIEAEIRAAVAATAEPRGIRYVCSGGHAAYEPGWHDVLVPCTGMLTVGWILGAPVLGAPFVTAVTCAENGCELGFSDRTNTTLIEAAEVLAALGYEEDGLVGRSHAWPSPPGPTVRSGMFGPGSTQRAIEALQRSDQVDSGFVALNHADVGTIEIDPTSCTACEMCANVCPTNALKSAHEHDTIDIDFDPRQCVACGHCVAVCPEVDRGAIRHAVGFDPSDWSRGRRNVRHESTSSCELCGKPVAPTAMLNRISAILGDEHAATMTVIAKRCIDCRGR